MPRRVGFFGPFGTFTEQAVRSQPDLAGEELVAFLSVPDVLDAVAAGEVDSGVVPIENSIEGVVNFSQDALVFDYDLLITREIVLDIELCLVARSGLELDDVKVVLSIPVATAQCHRYLRRHGSSPRTRITVLRRSRHASPPIAMGSRCSPVTSPTTLGTRLVSSSLRAMSSRLEPAMTGRRWSSTSGPTSRAA